MNISDKGKGVAVVIVTYKRDALLAKVAASLVAQICRPGRIIVVNNDSTHSTGSWPISITLPNGTQVTELVLNANFGASGGFYTGIKYALECTDIERVWVMDDDYFPEPTCLEKLLYADVPIVQACRFRGAQICETAARSIDFNNPWLLDPKSQFLDLTTLKDYQGKVIEIAAFSFEGTLFERGVLQKIGLPLWQFFICHDDLEYSFRARGLGYNIFLCPDARAQREFGIDRVGVLGSWKCYFAIRNYCHVVRVYGNRYLLARVLMIVLYAFGSNLARMRFAQMGLAARGLIDGLRGNFGEMSSPSIQRII